ncbi:hypothetical protein GF339_20215 [candidate division KSB3 bacterium]|uniref:Uncharacterized protein n=1 Tax=candidate division KSB3 bacterium TaxID=2044937 RepID=A0A9D5K016_9BACT|nr:hypothetical protein [candidate division KSB3 bacterium]
MNPDRSLQEVWQWKDAVSDLLTHVSIQERLEYLSRAVVEEKFQHEC